MIVQASKRLDGKVVDLRHVTGTHLFHLSPLLQGMGLRKHAPSLVHFWLITHLALALLVPAASTQTNFGFLQPLTDPVQCEPYAFAWTGGTPPYQLQVSVSGNWGKAYGISGLGGPGFPWTIPVPAGYAVSFELLDNANHVATAGPLTIQPSNDTSCFAPVGNAPSSISSATPSSTTASSTTTPSDTTSSTTLSSTEAPTTSSSMAPSTDAKSSVTPTSESPSSHPPSPSSSLASSVTPLTISPSSTSQASPATDVIWGTTITATIAATTTTIEGDRSPTPHRATLSTAAVAGLGVAGAAVLVLAGITIWFCRRRKRRSRSGAETNVANSDMPIDSDVISSLSSGGPQMSEAVTSARRPTRPLPTPSSSSRSDPFAFHGSRQLLLHTGSDDSDGSAPVSVSSHLQWDGAPSPQSTGASLLSPSKFPTDIQSRSRALDDSTSKSASPELALASRQALATDTKPPDSPPRDLPLRPSHPSRGPERIPQTYAAIPTDERSFIGVGAAGAHLMRFEEDGGVRLAGGLPGDVLDEDGNGSAGWVVHPPPYQRFR